MTLLSLGKLRKARFNSGGLILMDDTLLGGAIGYAGQAPELGGFLLAGLAGLEIPDSRAKVRFHPFVFLTVAFGGLHSLGRGLVCRQLRLLCSNLV